MAAPFAWYSCNPWLLGCDGTLVNYGYSSCVVLFIILVTLVNWYSLVFRLLPIRWGKEVGMPLLVQDVWLGWCRAVGYLKSDVVPM